MAKSVKAAEVVEVVTPTETEKKAAGFPVKEKNEWGHQVGSMGSRLDDLLKQPITIEAAAKILVKEFDRTEGAALAKAKLHFVWMLANHPTKISYDEATKKYAVKKD